MRTCTEDLAKDLKEHFQDVLDALEEQGADDEDSLLGFGIGWHGMFACVLVCVFVVVLVKLVATSSPTCKAVLSGGAGRGRGGRGG